MGWFRRVVLAVAFAALGAAAGRFVAESRRRAEAGEPFDPAESPIAMPGLRDLVPGLVAALRVNDRPWSYLHVPPWLAAFMVSFIVAAFGRDLPFLRAMGLGGADAPAGDEFSAPSAPVSPAEVWTAEAPRASTASPVAPPPTGFRPFAG